jgi:hypothetical protein
MTNPVSTVVIGLSFKHPAQLLSEVCSFDLFDNLVVIDRTHACLICQLSSSSDKTLVAYGSPTEEHEYLRTMFRLANQYTAVSEASIAYG